MMDIKKRLLLHKELIEHDLRMLDILEIELDTSIPYREIRKKIESAKELYLLPYNDNI